MLCRDLQAHVLSHQAVRTESTWDALLQRQVDITLDIESLYDTSIVYCHAYMVVCLEEGTGKELEKGSSYSNIMLMDHGVDGCDQRNTAEYVYSRHQKVQFYVRDTEALVWALTGLCFIHFSTMNPKQEAISMTDMHAGVRKRKTLQQLLRSTAFVYMVNRHKDTKDKHFAMPAHDVAMFICLHEELERCTGSSTQCTHGPPSHSGDERHS